MTESIEKHYGTAGIVSRIVQALEEAGLDRSSIDADSLSGADEFHIGGREGTEHVATALELRESDYLLDVGCGIGGPARYFAQSSGAAVTGIDLTPEFIEAALELTDLVGMAQMVDFKIGSATDIPFLDETFDAVAMLHVGMNVEDKEQMMKELARVCRPHGKVVIYDVTIATESDLPYPMPWSTTSEHSFPEAVEKYEEAAADAGLRHLYNSDHHDLAMRFFHEAPAAPSPVSLGHLMGPRMLEMRDNAAKAVEQGLIRPVMMVFEAS